MGHRHGMPNHLKNVLINHFKGKHIRRAFRSQTRVSSLMAQLRSPCSIGGRQLAHIDYFY